LIAAAFKMEQTATEPMHGTGLLASRIFWIGLAEYEAILAIFMLSGIWARVIRVLAIATFVAFLGFSIYQGLQGVPSCGCLGKASVSPWRMAYVDAVVAGLLLATAGKHDRTRLDHRRLRVYGIGVGIIASAATIPTMLGINSLSVLYAGDLVADHDVFDFGSLEPSKASGLVHEFRLENRSREPVSILSNKSSCRCTVAKVPQEAILPGSYAIIHVTANWRDRYGKQAEQVVLTTDSPKRKQVILEVTGDISAPVVFWPDVVDFGDVDEGEQAPRVVRSAPGPGQPRFKVLEASASTNVVTTVPEPLGESVKTEHRWTLQLKAIAPADHLRASVRFQLDLPTEKVITVPIVYNVVPAIRTTPQSLVFFSSEQVPSRSLRIESREELRGMSVKVASADSNVFVARITSAKEAAGRWEYAVLVELLEKDASVLSPATLVIRSDRFSSDVPLLVVK
jgi:hypothetical protein